MKVGGLVPSRRVRRALIAVAAALVAVTCAFDRTASPALGPPLAPLLSAVLDVEHGRTPLVDAWWGGGWGALDAVAGMLAATHPDFGTLALVLSALASVLGVVVVLALVSCAHSPASALAAAAGYVVLGILGPSRPQAYAPASGFLLLVVPIVAVIVGSRALRGGRWPVAAGGCMLLAVLWGLPATLLTALVLVARVRELPPADARRLRRAARVATAAGVALVLVQAGVRAGAVPDPRALLSLDGITRPGETDGRVLLTAALAALAVAAMLVTHRTAASPILRGLAVVGAGAAVLALLGPAPASAAGGCGLAVAALVASAERPRTRLIAGFACVVLLGMVSGTFIDRWHGSVLYAALPSELMARLGVPFGGGALHYDLQVLRNAPLQAPEVVNAITPLLPQATRRGDRVLVLGPPVGTTEALASAGLTTLLPLGDPTRRAPDASAKRALTRGVRELRTGDRLVVASAWLAPGRVLPEDALAARTALERVGERFALTAIGGSGAFTVVRLDPP